MDQPRGDAVPLGSYAVGDALEFLADLPPGAIDGVATSPPYNRAFRGRGRTATRRSTNWVRSSLMADGYGEYGDARPEAEYVAWQREFLALALAAVGPRGVVLYNIGRRIHRLSEDRRQAIVEGFPVRQTVVWNRGSSNNQGGVRPSIFPPIYELIYVLAGPEWRLPTRWLSEFRQWGDVWHVPFETGNPHPAPFPLALAERMVKVVDGTVCDPFAGSGTIGLAAERLGYSYRLNDHCAEYKAMFEERIREF